VFGVSGTMVARAETIVPFTNEAGEPTLAPIIKEIAPAVVNIATVGSVEQGQENPLLDDPFFDQFLPNQPQGQMPTNAVGSGVIVDAEEGYIITNHHVIANADEIMVTLTDRRQLEAELVGSDPETDIAVLKVDPLALKDLEFGNSDNLEVGDFVVAVGNPFGLGGTVTAGIVSARGRDIGAGPYDDFIQIDAAVNRGNSGGPTFDLAGQVVGINTAIFSPSGGNVGIAFAVPASTAKSVVKQLMADGKVQRGWLGVAIQPVTADIAESLGLKKTTGALVADPQADAPAAKAGIKAGDIITAVNGNDVKGPRELAREIAGINPGTDVDVTLMREGKEKTVTVKLGELPRKQMASAEQAAPDQSAETALSDFGMTVAPAEQGSGVVVTGVEPDSAAADAGIRVGEKIMEVNNQPVESASDIEKELTAVADSGRKAALLLLEQNDTNRFVAMPVGKG
jgi:serine protease Do